MGEEREEGVTRGVQAWVPGGGVKVFEYTEMGKSGRRSDEFVFRLVSVPN